MKKRIISLLVVFALFSTLFFKVNVNAESTNQTIKSDTGKEALNYNVINGSKGDLLEKLAGNTVSNDGEHKLLGDYLFEKEPNNTFETANDLPLKTYVVGTYDSSYTDVDVYKVVIKSDGLLKVKTTAGKSNYTLASAILHDENGNLQEKAAMQYEDSGTISEYHVTSGIYYITAFNSENSINVPYILSTSFRPEVYAPKVKSISDRDTKITGSAVTNSKVYLFANKKPLNNGTLVCDSKFSVKIKPLKAGTKVTAYQVYSGYKSEVVTLTVSDKTPPKTLKVNKITSKTKTITGKTEASASVEVKKGKKLLGKAKANKKGVYKIKIKQQKKGTTLTIIAKDKAKNAKTIKVKVK